MKRTTLFSQREESLPVFSKVETIYIGLTMIQLFTPKRPITPHMQSETTLSYQFQSGMLGSPIPTTLTLDEDDPPGVTQTMADMALGTAGNKYGGVAIVADTDDDDDDGYSPSVASLPDRVQPSNTNATTKAAEPTHSVTVYLHDNDDDEEPAQYCPTLIAQTSNPVRNAALPVYVTRQVVDAIASVIQRSYIPRCQDGASV
jgi:hypothetical protein